VSEWEWTERELPVSLGRLASAAVGGDTLYLVRHQDLATYRVDGDTAEPWHEPVDESTRVFLDDRNLQVTFDAQGVLYALLADGGVWRRERGGELAALSGPDLRTAGHYAHRTGFVWDSLGERLLVLGGDNRNDGYALSPASPELVPLRHGPGHGPGQTVATPHGVYRMVGGELWLLREQTWALVGRHDHARHGKDALLFFEPRRDALFFVSQGLVYHEPPVRVQMSPAGPSAAVKIPGSVEGPLAAHEAVAQIDPRSDRLWMVDRLGARFLRLDMLGLAMGSPVEPIAHERRVVATPPVHWYREAIALRQRDEEAPPIDLPVRDGWVLSATLPISPHLPLGEAGTVVLFSREVPYDFDPWTLGFMNAFEVRVVDQALPLTAGGTLLEQVRFLEVEPIFASQVDTAYDGSPHLARGSKIGGFPALVQGTREEAANAFFADLKCEDCEAHLRFVAQLRWPEWDLISAVIYLYACPFGHSAAARAQNV
jgi:hypothetical protein